MARVVIVGGGFAGCAAALAATKAGAKVTLIEKTDLIIGAGIRAGRMNNDGKLTAAEEMKALGGGAIFQALESIILHQAALWSDEKHGYTYNVSKAEPLVKDMILEAGVDLRLQSRAVDVRKDKARVRAVKLADGEIIEGDVFIDTSGSSGGVSICTRYGRGCVMCIYYRCPTYGDRVSIATKAGARELMRYRPDGTPGAVGAAVSIYKDTLSSELRDELETVGKVTVPMPKQMVDYQKAANMGAVHPTARMESINLLDIGPSAKCTAISYFPLEWFRKIPGFERAHIEDPPGGGRFNRIRSVSMAPRDDALLVEGFENLFCAGEKCGPISGVAECIATGALAGHNAVRAAVGAKPLVLPTTTVMGDYVAFAGEKMRTEPVLRTGYSLAAPTYFPRLVEKGLYTDDVAKIKARIEGEGLSGVMAKKLV
ncbi:MAG: FAD-dependent oxidoreductase [Dehalococcoidia bacterium]|nr:FAD-dependent oxidoreductase [Dehalococcoidia bacterium]